MTRSYQVTVPEKLLPIIDRIAAYQGTKRGPFTLHAILRHIRGMKQNLPFLTEDDLRVINGGFDAK